MRTNTFFAGYSLPVIFLLFFKTSAFSTIVINQVYGGGGNSNALFTNDFIELYNPGSLEVFIDGWSIQYAPASGSSWNMILLDKISIQPQSFFLIQLASGGSTGEALPAPDLIGSINLNGTSGKIILCTDQNSRTTENPDDEGVIDKLGYGSATGFEGTGPAPTLNNMKAVYRITNGSDSNDNSIDFTSGSPNPRNSTTIILSAIDAKTRVVPSVYPNPSTGILELQCEGVAEVMIIDSKGNIEKHENTGRIHTNLKGNAILIIKSGEGVYQERIQIY